MQPPGKTPGIMSLSPLPGQMEFSAQSGQFKLALKEWLAGTASRGFSIFSVFMGSKAEDLFCSLSGLALYGSHFQSGVLVTDQVIVFVLDLLV